MTNFRFSKTPLSSLLAALLLTALSLPVHSQQPPDGDGGPPPGTKPAVSKGDGMVAGLVQPDGSILFYCKDALISGFDWFARLRGWFPSVPHSSYSMSPTHTLVNMAYAKEGNMTFKNVVAPTSGSYNMTIRYAFASGLFGGINDRPMGVSVNGVVVTDNMHFPITHSFNVYKNSTLPIPLNAGVNRIEIFAVSDHGVSRVDTMTLKKP